MAKGRVVSLLAEILAHKRAELARLGPAPRSSFEPRSVSLARGPGEPLRLIAEIKLRSPSAGSLSLALPVSERAAVYQRAGANMLSVLTDARYFDGAFEHVRQAREATSLPVLCKEFIVGERQLDWARASGADAVLLIVRCLAPPELDALLAGCRQRTLAALVEVSTDAEATRALDAGAEWVGVNARDLDTLAMDAERAASVLDRLPPGVTRVHLSGVGSAGDVGRLAARRVDAALIGEALMRQADPGPLLAEMRAAAG